jgi:CRISPR-associated endonuclease/helicase Cas3
LFNINERRDTYLFDINKHCNPEDTDWDSLIDIFEEGLQELLEKNIQKFGTESKIVKIRQTVSDQCKEAATKKTGIYQLSVPTGGGKTLSSLRFSLHHCKAENKKRIIYVIPYLSIIEQTASEIRKILNLSENNDILLEHHSNIVLPDDEEEQEIRKLSTSRWDKTIVITTAVQFLETVMSSRGGDLRKFHNMSDSVIIFDEVQSLPIKSIHLFNETITFLAKFCNATILLCTATQPQLDKTERNNLLLEDNPNLIDCSNLFEELRRTRIVVLEEKNIDDFGAFISEKADVLGNCLAIVNTKKSALEVFERLKGKSDFEVYHLSTAMCSIHRTETISKIKDALSNKRKIICVATQLIEAGIDISFSCVVRAIVGLDSIAQAAGRCNRNGESESPLEVYVIPLKGENLDKLQDIKAGKEITERLIRNSKGADLLDSTIMD